MMEIHGLVDPFEEPSSLAVAQVSNELLFCISVTMATPTPCILSSPGLTRTCSITSQAERGLWLYLHAVVST